MTKTCNRPNSDNADVPAALPLPCAGLVVGVINGATCWVAYPNNPSSEAQRALVLAHVGEVLPGQTVLLQFLAGDLSQPVIMGVLPEVRAMDDQTLVAFKGVVDPESMVVNGETLNVSAKKKIVFRCGKASLTMHANGNIEIRGTELLSRASKQNAIRGASITLN